MSRGSRAATALLDSLDVGMDTSHVCGMQDWDHIRLTHASLLWESSWLSRLEAMLPPWLINISGVLSSFRILQFHNSKARFSILRNFIAAHEICQRDLPRYLGCHEGISSREEAILIAESTAAIEDAKALLAAMPDDSVRLLASLSAAIATFQATDNLVERLVDDGILSERIAEVLIEESDRNIWELEKRAIARHNDFQERPGGGQFMPSGQTFQLLRELSQLRTSGSQTFSNSSLPPDVADFDDLTL